MIRILLALLLLCSSAHALDGRQEIVVIVDDDVSPQAYGAYGESAEILHPSLSTPQFDSLATNGQLYLNATSESMCSPTRRSLMYGMHPLQHGSGNPIGKVNNEAGLGAPWAARLSLVGSAQALGWRVVHVGKFHLQTRPDTPANSAATEGSNSAAAAMGYDEVYCYMDGGGPDTEFPNSVPGSPHAQGNHHWSWVDINATTGVGAVNTAYSTDCITDATVAVLQDADPRPTLIMVWHMAAHSPYNPPPESVGSSDPHACATEKYDEADECYDEAIQYIDERQEEITDELDLVDEDLIIRIGDNGRPSGQGATTHCPLGTSKGNGTACGTRMALAIRGAGVTAYTTNGGVPAIVNVEDIHDTILEYIGGPQYAAGSQSFFDCFANPGTCAGRTVGYGMVFRPQNGVPIPMYEGEAFTRYEIHTITAENGTLYGMDRVYDVDLGVGTFEDTLLDLGSATIIDETARWGQDETADAGDAAVAMDRMQATITALEAERWAGPPNTLIGLNAEGVTH